MDKCSVPTIGRGTSVDADFTLGGNVLPAVTRRRDLGLTIVSDLSSSQYISEIASKAHQIANCILRSFSSGDIHLLLLYGSVAEWLSCWTQAQKGPGSNRSRDAVG